MIRLAVLGIVWILLSGMSCLENIQGGTVNVDGETVVGRECVPQPDGGKCCTSTAPIQGKPVAVTLCYAPDGTETSRKEVQKE